MRTIAAFILAIALPAAAHAASPALSNVLPRGGQRGTDVSVTFTGDRLDDAAEVMLYDAKGLTITDLKPVDAKNVKATIHIAADAHLGEYPLRLRTKSGISELRTFWVGPFPTTQEAEPNNDFDKPQPIAAMNVTVEGIMKDEDVDYFGVDAKKGQRLSVEVEGMRLGNAFFDPFVAILNKDRFEVASNDDSSLLVQDPIVSTIVPEDGHYTIQLRDSGYGGGNDWSYRMHVGTFTQPLVASPPGLQRGTTADVALLGALDGPTTRPVAAGEGDSVSIETQSDGVTAPVPLTLRVSPMPSVKETEPNGDPKVGEPYAGPLPVAFEGVIGDAKDEDNFRIKLAKDQTVDINIYARRLRSPLDSVLDLFDSTGKRLEGNDDNGNPDCYQRFTFPAEGVYAFRVRDQLQNGGPDYVYRMEVTPVQPKLTLSIPAVQPNSQERQAIAIPRGNRMMTMMRIGRGDFGGDVKLAAENLPAGVTLTADTATSATEAIPVLFEASADAPLASSLSNIVAKPVDEKQTVPSAFAQAADLVVGNNQVAYYQSKIDRLAVAVVDEVPFTLAVVQPHVPIVQNGSMQLKVIATRKEGFKAPIRLKSPFNPPGMGSSEPTIAEGQTETYITLNANGDAPPKKWKICVLGSADANGTMWVSSPLADLEVAPPYVAGKIEMASAAQGEHAQVVATLQQQAPFEGKATVQLVGLPPNATAEPKEFTSSDAQVSFDVVTSDKTPPGQHKTLFCTVTVTGANGEPIVHNIAGGGVLRVDKPKTDAPAPAVAAAAPTSQPAKPLSRLEKLRLEAKQARGS